MKALITVVKPIKLIIFKYIYHSKNYIKLYK